MNDQTTTFAQHVAERMAVPVADELRRFLILDLSAMRGHFRPDDLPWTVATVDLLTLQPVDWSQTASPVLAMLPAMSQREARISRWIRFADRWRFANAMTYLESASSLDELAKSLAEKSRARLSDGIEVLLRWFDNRVLTAMGAVLTEPNQLALFGDIAHLAYADRRGNVVLHEAPRSSVPVAALEISASEEAGLMLAAEPDVLIDLLLQQGQSQLIDMLPPDQFECVEALWRSALDHGIQQTPEQAAYCNLGLELGPDFAEKSPWQEVVSDATKRGGRLIEALSDYEALSA